MSLSWLNSTYNDLLSYSIMMSVQVEEMYRRMAFNLVCDNKDDHAKNFSFICRDGVWSLAPAYDITFSPEGSNGQHATSLFYDGNPGKDLVIRAGRMIDAKLIGTKNKDSYL